MLRFTFICLLTLSLGKPVLAQSLLKQADQQFDQLAYTKATELYEQLLHSSTPLTEGELRAVRAKLAYGYRQLRDAPNAEKAYRELISGGDLPTEYADSYLYYAQALATNGKYKEAQAVYETYNTYRKDDPRSPTFTKLYRDVTVLAKNAGSYKVSFLDVNTNKAEFSPVYYRNGLVFVSSGGGGGGTKRIFNWNNTPFLDLFYAPDVAALKDDAPATLGGSKAKKAAARAKTSRMLGRDDYTASTSNDSRTVGFYGGSNVTAGLGYYDTPVTESDQFSKTLNSKYHEGPATFTRDGARVIFTRNNYNNGKYRESSDGINKLKLYTATQTNGNWEDVAELPFNSDEYSTGHPSLSKDDKLLYFASDMPGGFGGTDIYVSRWDGKGWGAPVNLGSTVNTKGSEMFPYVDQKGNLYFASDGHAGLGGLDIFFAQLVNTGEKALAVQNLGEPINSSKDDFGLVTDGERKGGFFSSNRKNGGADDDIYRFTREGPIYPCRELIVNVYDAQTKAPLENSLVEVENKDGLSEKKQLKTDGEGNIRLCLDADGDFRFVAVHTGYVDNQIGFSTRGLDDDKPSRLDIPLGQPVWEVARPTTLLPVVRGRVTAQKTKKPLAGVQVIIISDCDSSRQEAMTNSDGLYEFKTQLGCDYTFEARKANMGTTGGHLYRNGIGSPDITMFRKGDVIKIDNIYYDLDKSDIRPEAAAELDKLVELMQKYPSMKIEMRSHTDSRASAQYNKVLSANRAKTVVAYLKTKGIPARRLTANGYGETMPVNKCKDGMNCTEEEYQLNRRTEIKILAVE